MIVRDTVNRRHNSSETDFWIRRPLEAELLEYASHDIMRIRIMYIYLSNKMTEYRLIQEESQRYVQLHEASRPDKNEWFLAHGILPQEILERSTWCKQHYHITRLCTACRRSLHQESFPWYTFQTNRNRGLQCNTCAEARRRRDGVTNKDTIWELEDMDLEVEREEYDNYQDISRDTDWGWGSDFGWDDD
jgi:hypothetical protein